jgi:hypothetical protein
VPWIKPLQDVIRSKAPKENSPLSRPVRDLVDLRLEAAGGWDAPPPYYLTLLVVLRAGALPEPVDSSLVNQLEQGRNETIAKVAASMPPEGAPSADVITFWERFGNALAGHCRPSQDAPLAVRSAVRSLEAEVVSEDELTYWRVRRSAEIDLDHLSEPGFH